MSRDVALRLSSLLQLVVIQGRDVVGEIDGRSDVAVQHPSVSVDGEQVSCTWPTSQPEISHDVIDEQVNIRIHPAVAAEPAIAILRGFANLASAYHARPTES